MILKKLFLDFEANRSVVKGPDLASTSGLELQLSRLTDVGYDEFLAMLCVDSLSVHVSIPNFKRNLNEDKFASYYNNCAIRMHSDQRNLVLSGDIMEVPDKRNPSSPMVRTFRVKSILFTDPSARYFGEIDCEAKPYIRTSDGWIDSELTPHPYIWDLNKDNLLSDAFMDSLKQNMPVPNYREVESKIRDWEDYLESRRIKLETDSKKGYDLYRPPEFMTAYVNELKNFTDGKAALMNASDRIGHVNRTDVVVTKDRYDSRSEEKLLAHLVVATTLPVYKVSSKNKKNSDFKNQLDAFIRSPCMLARESDKYKDGTVRPLVSLYDRRFSSCDPEEVEPEDLYREIDDRMRIKIKQAENSILASKAEESKRLLDQYVSGKLVGILEEFRSRNIDTVTKRVTARVESETENYKVQLKEDIQKDSNRISELSESIAHLEERIRMDEGELEAVSDDEPTGKHKESESKKKKIKKRIESAKKELDKSNGELDGLKLHMIDLDDFLAGADSHFDLGEEIRSEMESIVAIERKNLEDRRRSEIADELDFRYDNELNERVGFIEAEAEEERNSAKENHTMVLCHFFFEVVPDESENNETALAKYQKQNMEGLRLYKDLAGEHAILGRQTDALRHLKEGDSMNPYLIQALFSPSSMGKNTSAHMDPSRLEGLNESQKNVVTKAMSSNGLFLIQGPPGTGKTEVIARIATLLAEDGKKVLIASENNKAVDNAFGRLGKVPSIRPVRLIRDKEKRKSNPHAPEKLVNNFYNNIEHSLESEIENFDNYEDFMERISASLESLQSHLDRIGSLRAESESVSKRIAKLGRDIESVYKQINDIQIENEEMEAVIESYRAKRQELRTLDGDAFAQISGRVADAFGLERGSPEYRSLCLYLLSMSTMEIMDAVDLYRKNIELVRLCLRKDSDDTDPQQIVRLNGEIKAYERTNGVGPADIRGLMVFGEEVPDSSKLRDFKLELQSAIQDTDDELQGRIDECSRMIIDDSDKQSKIRRLNSEMEALKIDGSYKALSKEEEEFDNERSAIFRDLHITVRTGRREDCIPLIEDQVEELRYRYQSSGDDIRDRMGTYRRICKYISDENVIEMDRERYTPKLFENVNVIGMTCSSSNRTTKDDQFFMNLRDQSIDTVIIDEVSKVSFVELLQPILLGKTIILVGDHKQLPPLYNSIQKEEIERYDSPLISEENEARFRKMYESSFFNELFEKSPENVKATLTIQYRMHPDIMDIDNVFYRGSELTFGGDVIDKEHRITVRGANGRNIIDPGTHVLFVDTPGTESQESGSSSYSNENEALVVSRLLMSLNDSCKFDARGEKLRSVPKAEERKDPRLSLGVICTYADQTRLIKKNTRGKKFTSFGNNPDEQFMVKSVDDFQGDERDIIILSTVRTRKNCSFLAKFNRINVAVSRARRLLIIVGNAKALEQTSVELDGERKNVYRDMINSIKRKNAFISSTDVLGGGN